MGVRAILSAAAVMAAIAAFTAGCNFQERACLVLAVGCVDRGRAAGSAEKLLRASARFAEEVVPRVILAAVESETVTIYGLNLDQTRSATLVTPGGATGLAVVKATKYELTARLGREIAFESGDAASVEVASGFGSASGPAIRVDRLPVISVRSFGAVGNGVADDSAAIRTALQAVPDEGGTLYFPAGTYLVSQDPVRAWVFPLKSNLRVLGEGAATTKILLKTGADKWTRVFSGTEVENVVISDLEIDGQHALQAINSEQRHAIIASYARNMLVARTVLHGMSGDGVYFHGMGSNNAAVANEGYGNGRVVINFDGVSDSIAYDNLIHDNVNWAMKMEADDPNHKFGNLFVGNKVHGSSTGVAIGARGVKYTDMVIAGNDFELYGNLDAGQCVAIRTVARIRIQGNTCRGANGLGILFDSDVEDITIKENTIRDVFDNKDRWGVAAILMGGGALTGPKRITIEGNHIVNSHSGVWIRHTASSPIQPSQVEVIGNTFEDNALCGVGALAVLALEVRGNTFRHNEGGVNLIENSVALDNVSIRENIFEDNRRGGVVYDGKPTVRNLSIVGNDFRLQTPALSGDFSSPSITPAPVISGNMPGP